MLQEHEDILLTILISWWFILTQVADFMGTFDFSK